MRNRGAHQSSLEICAFAETTGGSRMGILRRKALKIMYFLIDTYKRGRGQDYLLKANLNNLTIGH